MTEIFPKNWTGMCNCNCCKKDSEGQWFACVLFARQCGCCPCMCCSSDKDGLCWACVCCTYQIDACFFPRQLLEGCCYCLPGGKSCKDNIEWMCCCPPNKEKIDEASHEETAPITNPAAASHK